MRRLGVAFLVCALVAGGACTKEENAGDKLNRFLKGVRKEPREFLYTEESGGHKTVVKSRVQDDLRWDALFSIDGAEVEEAIVSDDTLAVRVIDPVRLPGFEQAASQLGSEVVADALRRGQWVVDYQAAPPILATLTEEGSVETGVNAVLDSNYIFQYIDRAIDEGTSVWEFNKDDIQRYKPRDDPLPQPDKNLGIQRYDVFPPPLPRRTERGTVEALPATPMFRRLSFYVKGDRVIKILELIDFETHPDFRKSKEGKGPKYFLEVLQSVREGKTKEPIRTRRLTVEFKNVGKSIEIQLPQTNVLTASLGGFFGLSGFILRPESGGAEEATPTPQPAEQPAGTTPTP